MFPFQEFVEKTYQGRNDDYLKSILTRTDSTARQNRAQEWEEFKQSDDFKAFVLSNVPSKDNHKQDFNLDPTQSEYMAMLAEQNKTQALRKTGQVVLDTMDTRGGHGDHYDPTQHSTIVNDTEAQFNQNQGAIQPFPDNTPEPPQAPPTPTEQSDPVINANASMDRHQRRQVRG